MGNFHIFCFDKTGPSTSVGSVHFLSLPRTQNMLFQIILFKKNLDFKKSTCKEKCSCPEEHPASHIQLMSTNTHQKENKSCAYKNFTNCPIKTLFPESKHMKTQENVRRIKQNKNPISTKKFFSRASHLSS